MPAHDRTVRDLIIALEWCLTVIPEPMNLVNRYASRYEHAKATLRDARHCPVCSNRTAPANAGMLCPECIRDRLDAADRSDRGLHENPEL